MKTAKFDFIKEKEKYPLQDQIVYSIQLTLTEQGSLHYNSLYNMKKIVPSPTTSSPVGLYRYGNSGRTASQAWWAIMGDQGFGVREVRGSNPRGEPPFLKVSVSNEIG